MKVKTTKTTTPLIRLTRSLQSTPGVLLCLHQEYLYQVCLQVVQKINDDRNNYLSETTKTISNIKFHSRPTLQNTQNGIDPQWISLGKTSSEEEKNTRNDDKYQRKTIKIKRDYSRMFKQASDFSPPLTIC